MSKHTWMFHKFPNLYAINERTDAPVLNKATSFKVTFTIVNSLCKDTKKSVNNNYTSRKTTNILLHYFMMHKITKIEIKHMQTIVIYKQIYQ